MPRTLTCAALLANSLWAGSLRFSPDTICAGTGTGCAYSTWVRNLSNDTIVSTLVAELSPFTLANRIGITGMAGTNGGYIYGGAFSSGSSRYAYGQAFDSISATTSGNLLKTSHFQGRYGNYSITLWPGDSIEILRCDVGDPNIFVARSSHRFLAERASIPATNPRQLGNGELLGLVFTSNKGGSDTLFVKANEWLQMAGLRGRTRARNPSLPQFTADGKNSAPHSNGVQISPDGAHPNLR